MCILQVTYFFLCKKKHSHNSQEPDSKPKDRARALCILEAVRDGAGQQTALNGRVADWLLGWSAVRSADRWIVGVRTPSIPRIPAKVFAPLSLFIHSVVRRRSLYLNNV